MDSKRCRFWNIFYLFCYITLLIGAMCKLDTHSVNGHDAERYRFLYYHKPYDFQTALLDLHYEIRSSHVRSLIGCCMECHNEITCQSVNYRKHLKGGGQCGLNSARIGDILPHGKPLAVIGTNYYEPVLIGHSARYPARNCKFLKQQRPAFTSGSYWLKPNSSDQGDVFLGYCDMETDFKSGRAYLYMEMCTNKHFPTHDACGGNSADIGVTGPVENPHGNIFLR